MNWVGFFPFESPLAAQVDLRVRDGKIARGIFAPESGLTSVVDISDYETVDGLFDLINDAIVQDAPR